MIMNNIGVAVVIVAVSLCKTSSYIKSSEVSFSSIFRGHLKVQDVPQSDEYHTG